MPNESTQNHARSVAGRIIRYEDGLITIESDYGDTLSYKYSDNVFVYDSDDNVVSEGTVGNLIPGNTVLLRIYNEAAQDAVVMK